MFPKCRYVVDYRSDAQGLVLDAIGPIPMPLIRESWNFDERPDHDKFLTFIFEHMRIKKKESNHYIKKFDIMLDEWSKEKGIYIVIKRAKFVWQDTEWQEIKDE